MASLALKFFEFVIAVENITPCMLYFLKNLPNHGVGPDHELQSDERDRGALFTYSSQFYLRVTQNQKLLVLMQLRFDRSNQLTCAPDHTALRLTIRPNSEHYTMSSFFLPRLLPRCY
jgi:hypothetical protein